MDGFAFARALRKIPQTSDVRLLAVTGYASEEYKGAFEGRV